MRIGIDVRWLQKAMSHSQGSLGGIGTYSLNLIQNLLKFNSEDDYVLLVSKDIPVSKTLLDFEKEYSRVELVQLPREWRMPFGFNSLNKLPAVIQDKISIVPQLKHLHLDVFHSLEYNSFYRIQNCHSVVTVHDLIPFTFSHFYCTKISHWVNLLRVKTIDYASKVISVSESTKRDIVELLQIDESKIKIIYEGVESRFHPISNSDLLYNSRKKYGIARRYILHVGGISPTKNVDRLLMAFKKLLAMHRKDLDLVIAGNLSFIPYRERLLSSTLKELDLIERVILPGPVPDEDLVLLYNGACLVAYPSLYEGFGLPPLEAMACGTPVVVSNTASIPEVVGNAGLYVNPCKVDEIVSAMQKILTNKSLREEMVGKGLERTKLFSWKKMAKETLAVYKNIQPENNG